MRAAHRAFLPVWDCGIVGVAVNFKAVVRQDFGTAEGKGTVRLLYTIGAIRWDIYECKYYRSGFFRCIKCFPRRRDFCVFSRAKDIKRGGKKKKKQRKV